MKEIKKRLNKIEIMAETRIAMMTIFQSLAFQKIFKVRIRNTIVLISKEISLKNISTYRTIKAQLIRNLFDSSILISASKSTFFIARAINVNFCFKALMNK